MSNARVQPEMTSPMSLATIMLAQLAVARRIIEDGQELVPAWRIQTPGGIFLLLTVRYGEA